MLVPLETEIIRIKKKKKWLVPFVGIIICLALITTAGLFYFQSHFFVTAKANGMSIGMLNAKAAKDKLEELNKAEEVIIKADGKEEKLVYPQNMLSQKNF